MAAEYDIRIIYDFGSRAAEALAVLSGKTRRLAASASDLEIGIKPGRLLAIRDKARIAGALEDIFAVPRVDLVILPDAPAFLALEIVQGELLHAADELEEAEYQLYVMRRAADLAPFERARLNFHLRASGSRICCRPSKTCH